MFYFGGSEIYFQSSVIPYTILIHNSTIGLECSNGNPCHKGYAQIFFKKILAAFTSVC